jgi:hypothetical protein
LYAQARNVYLKALSEPRFSDVDYLVVVDTDMCAPWDVDGFEGILNALMETPSSTTKHIDAVYAYGACGWFESSNRASSRKPVLTPGAFARYCDLFALQDMAGRRHVTKQGTSYITHVGGAWRLPMVGTANVSVYTQSLCNIAEQQGMRECTIVNGQPVVPVRSAFGGLGVYRASLFRAPSTTMKQGKQSGPCEYASDVVGDECEHVPLSKCLYAHGHVQVIALQLVVAWEKEACRGDVADTITTSHNTSSWSECPCNHV